MARLSVRPGLISNCKPGNLDMTGKMTNTTYLLRLGDGNSWHIIAMPGTRLWAEKFATIMQLKPDGQNQYSRSPKMFFSLKDSGKHGHGEPNNLIDSKIEGALPRSGWKAHDFRSLQFWSHQASPDIICEIGNESNHELDIIRMWTVLYIIYLRVQASGGLPLHAALIEREGKGILLAGPGCSGKSTLCRRLPRPWRALSDDQTLIVRDEHKTYLSHPIPTWSDYLWQRAKPRWNVERYIPLKAIFFIEQARYNQVVLIGQGQAAVFINYSSTDVCRAIWRNLSNKEERKLKKKIFDNSCQLARAVPAYILHTSPNGRFWDEMERVLRKQDARDGGRRDV